MYVKGQAVTVKGIAGVFGFDRYVELDGTETKAKLDSGRIVDVKDLSVFNDRESCMWLH